MTWTQIADGEEGDETDWDAVTENGSSTLDVSTDAKKNGSYGWKVTIVGNDTTFGTFTGPSAETAVTFELQFDPNSITMATNDEFHLAYSSGIEFIIYCNYDGTNYRVRAGIENDADGYSYTSSHNLTDAYQKIRTVWKASSGSDDGFLCLYVDDILRESITGVDNDTKTVSIIYAGAVGGIDNGTSGVFYMDDCQWEDIANYEPLVLFARYRDYFLTAPQKFEIASNSVQMTARYKDYFLTAPQKFTISSNTAQMTARYRDYFFTAPKREGYD